MTTLKFLGEEICDFTNGVNYRETAVHRLALFRRRREIESVLPRLGINLHNDWIRISKVEHLVTSADPLDGSRGG